MTEEHSFNEIYKNRRSIRKYKEDVHISKEEMEAIINETMLTPTSYNMQPCRFVIVDTPAGKEKIKPYIKFNGLQNDTSSAMVFVFGDYQCFDNGEEIYQTAVDKGLMPKEVKAEQMAGLTQYYAQVPKQALKERILLDGGLICMSFMLVARNHGYDTCPMGGFEKEVIAKVLGLDEERYFPILMLSIGKADDQGYPSYRLPAEKLIIWDK